MTEQTLQLDIPLLLPDIDDERDRCVERLQERILHRKGIQRAHIERSNGDARLCLHFDPNLLSLPQVERLAEAAGAEITDRFRHEHMRLAGMDCADCATSIEHILGRMDGVLTASVNYAAERLWVEYDSNELSHETIVERVRWMGYEIAEDEEQPWYRQHLELILSVLSGLLLATGFFGQTFFGLSQPAAIAIYALAYLAGGYDAAHHGIKAALNLRFDIDALMVVAAVGAAVLGEWAEGALLLFLFSLGHALEHYAMDRARHAIDALGDITPKTARVRRDGHEEELPVEKLERGDVVIVRPGERLPIDGTVLDGQSAIDQSPVTGESVPVEKTAGDDVFAGTINGDGALEIKVTKLAQDTTLARVIELVEEAQAQKSPTQRFTQRFERIFVPAVLGITALVIIVPPLVGWLPWQEAFLRAMTILVAASPCALAISTPSAVLSGVAQAARNGVLIKGGVHLENLGALNAIAFDKTGTITHGEPAVTDLIPFDGTDETELLRIAAGVETRSGHPLAEAVVRRAQERSLTLPDADDLQSITGRGVRARLDGETVRLGNLALFDDGGRTVPASMAEQVQELEAAGKTTMLVQAGDHFLGIIALADRPRDAAPQTMQRLRRLGITVLQMLTGDNERVAATIADQVGLTDYRAGLLPDEKVDAIEELLAEHGKVAMIGDGVNDAPALTTATVGIAMGAGGTDVALETADVALMADDIGKLPFAVGLSRQSRNIIRQNVVISMGVIALLIPAALFGVAGIGPAIVFHEGSTLLVVANALRLLGYREEANR